MQTVMTRGMRFVCHRQPFVITPCLCVCVPNFIFSSSFFLQEIDKGKVKKVKGIAPKVKDLSSKFQKVFEKKKANKEHNNNNSSSVPNGRNGGGGGGGGKKGGFNKKGGKKGGFKGMVGKAKNKVAKVFKGF